MPESKRNPSAAARRGKPVAAEGPNTKDVQREATRPLRGLSARCDRPEQRDGSRPVPLQEDAGDHAQELRGGGAPWRSVRRHLPLTHRPYDLRHSMATMLLEAGKSPKIVAERLGHASIVLTLNTYSHVNPGMQQDAADALDDALFGRGR